MKKKKEKQQVKKTVCEFLYSKKLVFTKEKQLIDWLESTPQWKNVRKLCSPHLKSIKPYLTAIIHTSFANEQKSLELENNERLEFLGDTLLDAVIATHLFNLFPEQREGELSKLKSSLVNENILTLLAQHIELPSLLLLGYGEFASGGSQKSSLLSNFLEALIGAIYLEHKYKGVEKFILSLYSSYEKKHKTSLFTLDRLKSFDAKTQLQEFSFKKYKKLPHYKVRRLTSEEGTSFEAILSINNKELAKAHGPSKKEAEAEAANKALKKRSLYVT